MPGNDDLATRDIWPLPPRIASQARGDNVACRDLAQRYPAIRQALSFEGHIRREPRRGAPAVKRSPGLVVLA